MARKPADQSVNRDEIIVAAADVLRRNGYESTTMKDIAAKVNLTAASLYHHFANKDALLLAVLEAGLQQAIQQIQPVVQSDVSSSEKLREMIRVHITNLTDNTAVGAAMVFEVRPLMQMVTFTRANARSEDKMRAEFRRRRDTFFQQRDDFERMFHEVIRTGIKNGEFCDVDVAIFVKMMLGAHNWVGVWYREGGRLTGDEIASMMAENFLRALKTAS